MNSPLKRKWKSVYERLPLERKDKTLTEISGFTNYCSNPVKFRETVLENLRNSMGETLSTNVCEVGCGCGDKLSYFYNLGCHCHGIDYSKNMISRGKNEMPNAQLYACEANKLPFDDSSMDFVFSYSVFIYFETQEYFQSVLSEMYRVAKPSAKICVWDVPDIKYKEEVHGFRGAPSEGYEHTYYDMNDFFHWFKSKGVQSIKSEYFIIPEYKLSNYRFNITAIKN